MKSIGLNVHERCPFKSASLQRRRRLTSGPEDESVAQGYSRGTGFLLSESYGHTVNAARSHKANPPSESTFPETGAQPLAEFNPHYLVYSDWRQFKAHLVFRSNIVDRDGLRRIWAESSDRFHSSGR